MAELALIFDRVLIEREKSALERRTEKSGLLLADQTKDSYKASEGKLIACADGCADEVKALIGKKILFNKYSGDDIKVGDNEYLLAVDTDVFGELID